MIEILILKRLWATAQKEAVPDVHVSSSVIAALNAESYDDNQTWAWIASLSTAAALVVGVMAYQTFDQLIDPLQGLVSNFTWIIT
jgi:hypothetical protein